MPMGLKVHLPVNSPEADTIRIRTECALIRERINMRQMRRRLIRQTSRIREELQENVAGEDVICTEPGG